MRSEASTPADSTVVGDPMDFLDLSGYDTLPFRTPEPSSVSTASGSMSSLSSNISPVMPPEMSSSMSSTIIPSVVATMPSTMPSTMAATMPATMPATLPSSASSVASSTPSPAKKSRFTACTSPSVAEPPSDCQMLHGPSHQYDLYKQQTPMVPGAVAQTLAINDGLMYGYGMDYVSDGSYNMAVQQEYDNGFDSSGVPLFYSSESSIDPAAVEVSSSLPTTQTCTVGRMYPGMHQQAALAKQMQQRQRQQQQQQLLRHQELFRQQNQQRQQQQRLKQTRMKMPPVEDPMVAQKISQVLNAMRTTAGTSQPVPETPRSQLITKLKKEEEDMDDDERLLASEEGKKLSSKERRQLRNKVSARAFRSRRKEYINQLESEVATVSAKNHALISTNNALVEENARLSKLTRALLSSPSFSAFLDHLATHLPEASTSTSVAAAVSVPVPVPGPSELHKDVDPYQVGPQAIAPQFPMAMYGDAGP